MTSTVHDPRVVIVGQGYVGLPLAVAAAAVGMDVTGVDLDKRRVDQLNAGKSPVGDVSDETLGGLVRAGRYRAAVEFDAVAEADVVVLCVPTPYHETGPDLSYVEGAAGSVGAFLREGALVILESTTYPGTTEEVLRPILESASGLRVGADFHLAFSPERIDPGNETYGLRNTPKIVGGLSDEGTDRAAEFYGAFVDTVVRVSNPKTAEMAKLLENTFRHINIALVNELAILSQDLGVDIWEVIEAAASKPFGFMPFYPGPGVGGHCIPVDPLYLSWRVRQFGGAAKFIELARDVNAAMPAYCVTRVQDLLNERGKALNGARILVLGVAYKPNVSDLRESPALPILDLLIKKGADVAFSDPFVDQVATKAQILESVDAWREVERADCVLIVTAHSVVDHEGLARHAKLVFDTRHVVNASLVHAHQL
jgi:UDP-N-acetyl-D-glucosamine dehydrogenase